MVTFPNESVYFPIAQAFSQLNCFQTLFNTYSIWYNPTFIILNIVFSALFLTPQLRVKVTSSSIIGQDVLVNPFMTDRDTISFQPSRYLFRAPVISQSFLYQFPGRLHDPWLGLRLATHRFFVRLLWAVAAFTTIPFQLSTNRRFMYSDFTGNLFAITSHCFQVTK